MAQDIEERKTAFSALQFAWELGYLIALPLVGLLLAGKLADSFFHTAPWLMLGGLLLSLVITGFIIWYKVQKFL